MSAIDYIVYATRNIFGETRDLTEEETEIYDKMIDSESVETGEKLF